MKKNFYLYKILTATFYLLLIIPSYSFSIEDNIGENLAQEERELLEKLNILKKNNVSDEAKSFLENEKKDTPKYKKNNQASSPKNTKRILPTATTKPVINTKNVQDKKSSSNDLNVVNTCNRENKQLQIANQKITELTKELSHKKQQLILVETEVERLSEVIERKNRAELGSNTNTAVNNRPQKTIEIRRYKEEPKSEAPDMPIAVVVSNKANLRAGPSLKDSPLLEVSKGTRLVVETRQGSWYRVMAPNGKRAWVSSDVVNFGPTSSWEPSYTTRIKGYNQNVEDRTESILD